MDPNFEALVAAECQRLDDVLKLLERFLRPGRKSDGSIQLPALHDSCGGEE